MTKEDMEKVISVQKEFFKTGATLDIASRKKALKKLLFTIEAYEEQIYSSLYGDLGKSREEAYFCEIGLVKSEIRYMLRHMKSFARDRRVLTPLSQFCAKSFVKTSPYGVVLIMSPWNYPFLLSLEPLVDALSAGNVAVIKPSAYSQKTSELLERILGECFPKEYVSVISGGRRENESLLDLPFDYIFFTGSKEVGKTVMKKASERLCPITLELGGKSPCIVDETANISLSARRIVFAKFLNCGQTCVAPDYILCHKSVKDKFVTSLKQETTRQYTKDPLSCSDYGKIINEKHFDRILNLLEKDKIVFGGRSDRASLKIEPTILDNASFDDPVMKEEIFGPIIPIIEYESTDEIIEILSNLPKPLAFYVFSQNKKTIRLLLSRCSFGGGCVNDAVIHLATSRMGFGGVGESGMGAYHGKVGFDTFSHKKSIVDKKTFLDLPMRYRPYKKFYQRLIRLFLR